MDINNNANDGNVLDIRTLQRDNFFLILLHSVRFRKDIIKMNLKNDFQDQFNGFLNLEHWI